MSELERKLRDAIHEIRSLRRENEILRAKVEVMDTLACFLHTEPARRTQAFSPDVVHALELEIQKMDRDTPTSERDPAI